MVHGGLGVGRLVARLGEVSRREEQKSAASHNEKLRFKEIW